MLERIAAGKRNRVPRLLSTIALCACAFVLIACRGERVTDEPTPAATEAATGRLTVVAMGDSLTEGYGVAIEDAYPAQLESMLNGMGYPVQVVNAGNSGETSSGARSRLEWVMGLEPDIVILATGGNDGLRGIDPALTGENLEAIVSDLMARDVVVILAGMEIVENMGETYTAAFRAVYPAVADRYDLLFMPFLLEGVAADPAFNQPDFIHPNEAGHALIAENLVPYLVEATARVQGGSD